MVYGNYITSNPIDAILKESENNITLFENLSIIESDNISLYEGVFEDIKKIIFKIIEAIIKKIREVRDKIKENISRIKKSKAEKFVDDLCNKMSDVDEENISEAVEYNYEDRRGKLDEIKSDYRLYFKPINYLNVHYDIICNNLLNKSKTILSDGMDINGEILSNIYSNCLSDETNTGFSDGNDSPERLDQYIKNDSTRISEYESRKINTYKDLLTHISKMIHIYTDDELNEILDQMNKTVSNIKISLNKETTKLKNGEVAPEIYNKISSYLNWFQNYMYKNIGYICCLMKNVNSSTNYTVKAATEVKVMFKL